MMRVQQITHVHIDWYVTLYPCISSQLGTYASFVYSQEICLSLLYLLKLHLYILQQCIRVGNRGPFAQIPCFPPACPFKRSIGIMITAELLMTALTHPNSDWDCIDA